jgi:hypothetical protein
LWHKGKLAPPQRELRSNWLATERVRPRGKAYATTHLSEDRIVCAFERRVVIDLQKEREILNEP